MKYYLFENIYIWHESSGNCMNLLFIYYKEVSLEILNALRRVKAKKHDFFLKGTKFYSSRNFLQNERPELFF